MPRVGFELTITVFERAKTFHALDHAATVKGPDFVSLLQMHRKVIQWITGAKKGHAVA
jgi:hypothetical protein